MLQALSQVKDYERIITINAHYGFSTILVAALWFVLYLIVLRPCGISDSKAQKITCFLNALTICQAISMTDRKMCGETVRCDKNSGYEMLVLNASMGYLLFSTAFWKWNREEWPIYIGTTLIFGIFAMCLSQGHGALLVLHFLFLLEVCTPAFLSVFLLDDLVKTYNCHFANVFNVLFRLIFMAYMCYYRFYLGFKFANKLLISPKIPMYIHAIFPIVSITSICHLILVALKTRKDYIQFKTHKILSEASITTVK